jgi:hypothetical protein
MSAWGPGCVKTRRGIATPGILSPVVMRRAEKRKNSSSARLSDQIGFRFRTAWVKCRHAACPVDHPRKDPRYYDAALGGTLPAHAEFCDLISRSIVSMAASILANDLPARILASA